MSGIVGRGNRGRQNQVFLDSNNVNIQPNSGGPQMTPQYTTPVVPEFRPGYPSMVGQTNAHISSPQQGYENGHQVYSMQQPQQHYESYPTQYFNSYPRPPQDMQGSYDQMRGVYQPNPQQQMFMMQQHQAVLSQQPAPQPQRKKNILSFVDPATQQTITLPEKSKGAKPEPVPTASSNGAPVADQKASESDDNKRKEFAQKIATVVNASGPPRSRTQSRSEAFQQQNVSHIAHGVDFVDGHSRGVLQRTPEREMVQAVMPMPTTAQYASLAAQLEAVKNESSSEAHSIEPIETPDEIATPPAPAIVVAEADEPKFAPVLASASAPALATQVDSVPTTVVVEDEVSSETKLSSPGSPEESDEVDEKKKAEEEAENKLLREKELDGKIAELLQATEEVDLSSNVYGRLFLTTIRDIEKEFKRTPCPLSAEQLDSFGLDINAMPKAGERKTTNFNTPWMSQNRDNKPRMQNYRGRITTDGSGRGGRNERGGHGKRAPGPRPSIDRVVEKQRLPTSKNAWKPDRLKSEDLSAEEARTKEVCKKVRSLMNKITPTSKDELIKEFINYDVSSNEQLLAQVVDIIFDKAIEEPKFCSIYAEVCKRQVDHELNLHQNKQTSLFRNQVLNRAQQTFFCKTQDEKTAKEALIESETDAAKKTEMQIQLMEEEAKFRRRKFGNITFIGHLFRNQLLSTRIVQACLTDLLVGLIAKDKKPTPPFDEESLHCALQLMETLGSILDRTTEVGSTAFLDFYLGCLDRERANCSNKIRFMIMNLIELRKNKWVHRKSVETGPKKLTEIHKEIQQEQIENEKQRDNYDRRHGGVRQSSNSLRKHAPVARNSLDNRYGGQFKGSREPEQRRATAAANTKLTASTVTPKNVSVLSENSERLGGSRKAWKGGAAGGGTTQQEAPKVNAWTKDNTNQRKSSAVEEKKSVLAAVQDVTKTLSSARRSASQTSIAETVDDNDTQPTEEQLEMYKKVMTTIKSDIEEVCSGELTIVEMAADFVGYPKKERYGYPPLPVVFEMAVRAATELRFKPQEKEKLGHVLVTVNSTSENTLAFVTGVANLCQNVVNLESWDDFPDVWTTTGEVLFNVMHCPQEVKGQRPEIKDFEEAIVISSQDDRPNKPFELLVTILKKKVEAELKESGAIEVSPWEFSDLKLLEKIDRERLDEGLRKCKPDVPSGKTLYELLTQ